MTRHFLATLATPTLVTTTATRGKCANDQLGLKLTNAHHQSQTCWQTWTVLIARTAESVENGRTLES